MKRERVGTLEQIHAFYNLKICIAENHSLCGYTFVCFLPFVHTLVGFCAYQFGCVASLSIPLFLHGNEEKMEN